MSDVDIDFDSLEDEPDTYYQTAAAEEMRQLARDSLALSPGMDVLSIGPGPGFEPAEIAAELNQTGSVVGIEASAGMAANATARCGDFPSVDITRGDAVVLPYTDKAFDVAVASGVYGHVERIEQALDELQRVLRPTGRVAIFEADWETMAYYTDDQERTERVLDAFRSHAPRPRLPRTLVPKLERAGFEVVDTEAYTTVERSLSESDTGFWLSMLVEDVAANILGPQVVDTWYKDIQRQEDRGTYFHSLSQYLFVAEPE